MRLEALLMSMLILGRPLLAQEASDSKSVTEESEIPTDSDSKAGMPTDPRFKDNHGLGFGPEISNISGMAFFYDYNLILPYLKNGKRLQIHTQLSSLSEARSNIFGNVGISVAQARLTVSSRVLFSNGWFLGVGIGPQTTTLNYNGDERKEFVSSSVMGISEGGWQGDDGYYFHVGYRLAGHLTQPEQFDPAIIPDTSNHRATAAELWDESQLLTSLTLGFGWYIKP